jgi:hypothetical protein
MQQETVSTALARFRAMEEARRPWVSVWQELCDYVLPRKNSFLSATGALRAGEAGDENIFDATPPHALELLASSLGGMLTNPAIPWFDLRTRDRELGEIETVKEYLQECRRRMVAIFNSEETGFQTQVHELYLDIALLGTACLYVEADPQSVVRFSARPLGEIHVAENARGVVDTIFRRYQATARQMVQTWGKECSERVRALAERDPERKVDVLHAVFPRADRDPYGAGAKNNPYASLYVEVDARHLLEESGYVELPYMVPRWAKAAGEVYGRGPGLTALSDVRVLNVMARTALMAAEKMADSPLMVPDDGFLGPVNTGPGGISYYRAGSSDRIEPLPVKMAATERMMQQRRDSIRSIFLNDQLQLAGGANMSATEATLRQNEKMRVLGPVVGRLQTEFLSPLINRVYRLMRRAGELPEPPAELRGRRWRVEYASPIAKAQKQYEAQALSQTMQYLAPFVGANDPYGVMDNFDVDAVARGTAELFGAPTEYVRPARDVLATRAQKARAAQAGQAAGEMERVAELAKTLSETKMEDDNALGRTLQTLSGLAAAQPAAAAPGLPQDVR